jgi:hypothetical protein
VSDAGEIELLEEGAGVPLHGVKMAGGAVRVGVALHKQDQCPDGVQPVRDVPAAQVVIPPHLQPRGEHAVDVIVAEREPTPKVGDRVRHCGGFDSRDRPLFDEDVWRGGDDAGDFESCRSVEQGDAGTVAVSGRQRAPEPDGMEESGEDCLRLVRHRRRRPAERSGAAMTVPGVGEHRGAAEHCSHPLGESLPPRDRPESLVDENQGRAAVTPCRRSEAVLDGTDPDRARGHPLQPSSVPTMATKDTHAPG